MYLNAKWNTEELPVLLTLFVEKQNVLGTYFFFLLFFFSVLLSTSIGELNGFLYIFFLPLCGAVEQLFYHRVLVLFCFMCSHEGANTQGGPLVTP